MPHSPSRSILTHFATQEDPRQHAKVVYPLVEILLLALTATVAGADDFVETTLWGQNNQSFLRRFFPYENGISSHDTLCDVFAAIDPGLFKTCFLAWVEDLRDGVPEVIAIWYHSLQCGAEGLGWDRINAAIAMPTRPRRTGQPTASDRASIRRGQYRHPLGRRGRRGRGAVERRSSAVGPAGAAGRLPPSCAPGALRSWWTPRGHPAHPAARHRIRLDAGRVQAADALDIAA